MKMIANIDPIKSAMVSVFTLVVSEVSDQLLFLNLSEADIFFSHATRTIAILAGLVAITNGITKIIDWFAKRKNRHEEK